jgi:branched-chain amino acid transport system substrate-binding protein
MISSRAVPPKPTTNGRRVLVTAARPGGAECFKKTAFHAVRRARQAAARIAIRAVIMVPTYRAAARFIESTRDLYPGMIYTSVSFVGSTALANELMLLGSKYATGVIVTQVVPAVDGHSSVVLDYKSALAKYFPGESAD